MQRVPIQAEDLRLGEARLHAILDGMPEGVSIVDRDGRLRFINPAGLALFEIEQAGDLLLDIVAPEYRDQWRANHARACAGERVTWEFEVMNPTGDRRRIETHAVPWPDDDGTCQQLGVSRDISERHRAEERLRQSEMLLATFMKHSPVGMYLKDCDGRYLMLNPEMRKVFGGRPAEALIGLTAADLLSAEEAAMVAEYDREILETGRPRAVEEYLQGLDSYSWSLVVRFPVGPDGNEPMRIGGFDIDITDQKLAEEALQRSREALHQSEKLTALGSLLAGVAHELNNPLAAVVGQAELLEDDAQGTRFEDRARKIAAAGTRCAHIVRTFLAMARQHEPERCLVKVNELLSSALDITDYGLRTAGIAIRVMQGSPEPVVDGDRDQLHQVLVNLIVNAQQAMEKGRIFEKVLTIRTSIDQSGRVLIDFNDTGPGVPAELANRIFEPFFTTKASGTGTGIGLSFSQGIVEAHGGTLTLEPSRGGAHFRVALPAAGFERAGSPGPELPSMTDPSALRRVLIVEDEGDVAETLRELLEREGFNVTVAANGTEAFFALDTQEFDLLFSDLRMPLLDGPDLYDRLLEIRPGLVERMAFVTGDTIGERMTEFLQRCRRPVLEKPFTRAGVRAVLAALLVP